MRRLKLPLVKRHWIYAAILLILVVAAGYGARAWYNRNLAAVSSSQQITYFEVKRGDSLHTIASNLEQAKLIRSAAAFEAYVRGRGLYAKMQAGTYVLKPSMSTPQIVDKIVLGDVSKSEVTIYPGKTIQDVRQIFKQVGYSDAELDAAFSPAAYPDVAILAYLPSGASLEGFLYPDTFQKAEGTPAQTIIRESLDEMQSHLTASLIAGFKSQGLSVFQGVTLASIVNQESGDPVSQPTIAQVFLSRLKQDMPLQSNVTANYASDLTGVPRTVTIQSPYNTYLHTGLPPGPIGNMTDSALNAVAHPASTDYLFFVVGQDCKIHFTHTQAEHDAAIQKYGLGCNQ